MKKNVHSSKTLAAKTLRKTKQKGKCCRTIAEKPRRAQPGQETPVRKATSIAKTSRKTKQKGKCSKTMAEKPRKAQPGPETPDQKATKTSSTRSTPSTMTLHSTSESKRTATLMTRLDIQSPPKKTKRCQDATSVINFSDAAMIDWLSKEGLNEALEHYGEDLSELKKLTCTTRLYTCAITSSQMILGWFIKASIRRQE